MNSTALKLSLFAIAAICIGYGAYQWYGWGAVAVVLIVIGLAAWENLSDN